MWVGDDRFEIDSIRSAWVDTFRVQKIRDKPKQSCNEKESKTWMSVTDPTKGRSTSKQASAVSISVSWPTCIFVLATICSVICTGTHTYASVEIRYSPMMIGMSILSSILSMTFPAASLIESPKLEKADVNLFGIVTSGCSSC